MFVNNSGIGFYPHFVRQREEQEQHGHVKRVAFVLALRSVMRRYFRLRMKLHMDQAEALEHVTPFFSSATTVTKLLVWKSVRDPDSISGHCGCARRHAQIAKISCS